MGTTAERIQSSPAENTAMTSAVYVSILVPTNPLRAFEAFTRDIAQWWQPGHLFRITPQGDGALEFEPGQGGRLIARFSEREPFEIGRVSVWEPGERLVFTWRQASFEPSQSTEVEVRFESVGSQTRVSVQHRAWDTLPQKHVARHGFPEAMTLRQVAGWWRASLAGLGKLKL
jgi:uncharacterized protein YndB with AHSA1/START domain